MGHKPTVYYLIASIINNIFNWIVFFFWFELVIFGVYAYFICCANIYTVIVVLNQHECSFASEWRAYNDYNNICLNEKKEKSKRIHCGFSKCCLPHGYEHNISQILLQMQCIQFLGICVSVCSPIQSDRSFLKSKTPFLIVAYAQNASFVRYIVKLRKRRRRRSETKSPWLRISVR